MSGSVLLCKRIVIALSVFLTASLVLISDSDSPQVQPTVESCPLSDRTHCSHRDPRFPHTRNPRTNTNMLSTYQEPLSLVIISSISIGLGAVAAAFILADIILRKGWRSMMAIMMPVYVINALYLWPITLWVYLKYGRPSKPKAGSKHCHNHGNDQDHKQSDSEEMDSQHSACHNGQSQAADQHKESQEHRTCHAQHEAGANSHQDNTQKAESQQLSTEGSDQDAHTDLETGEKPTDDNQHQHHCHDNTSTRPFFATVTAGVCHCGAGCVLGDIIGEWLVYGTNATLGSNPPRTLWAAMLVDFGFAFLFGLVFQYFSIAPMSGDYSYRSLVRALKADAFSLLSFEIGLFAWMAAYQIGIFHDQLPMTTVTYWWMMQIGMFIGHWTGVPVNWWLIKAGVKEPCC